MSVADFTVSALGPHRARHDVTRLHGAQRLLRELIGALHGRAWVRMSHPKLLPLRAAGLRGVALCLFALFALCLSNQPPDLCTTLPNALEAIPQAWRLQQ